MTTSQTQRRSTFSSTCSRLSQYIKDQGGLIARPLPTTTTTKAETVMQQPMDLFPQHAGFGSDTSIVEKPKKNAQLTIFYGGQVLVFDGYPAEKAMDLMKMAASSTEMSSVAVNSRSRTTTNLPIARRASLHRFLQKRKDRINSKAPYQVTGSQDSSKPKAAALPWFLMGDKISKSSESCR